MGDGIIDDKIAHCCQTMLDVDYEGPDYVDQNSPNHDFRDVWWWTGWSRTLSVNIAEERENGRRYKNPI